MKYFFETDDTFMNLRKRLSKAFIDNSYMNDKTCVSPYIIIKKYITHMMDTSRTHAT